ncbi:hypothetical protein [Jannaschia seohaensis]|uniref:Avidin family protein n=1 Tax=Jannaschia seohaensis TaxID=475081 RepID=A0A2Y9B944_9RHOB|nr:hypothetical protein [Jannaschia seohaensis]PWJ12951.1 hypothetical protein BCF38_11587 [Jannaschia seohaensis]SSA50759.1 hypothetical protein SAMN05421539_11587 [Jannaschia seohaensis]
MKIATTTTRVCMLAAGAAAAETFSGGVLGRGTGDTTMMPVSETLIVMKTDAMYESFEVAPGHPLEGASGPCFGAVEIKAGAVTGSGRCVYDTASGDKAVMMWQATGLSENGALTGEWSISGGTGAWATATGSGGFSSLTDPETGKFVNTISGDIVME